MYNKLFDKFNELQGTNYSLRCPNERHLEGLVAMLQDPEVIKNSTHKIYKNIEEVKQDYLTESYYNFRSKISICFVIEENVTGKCVGFREVFVDSNKENVTIQGFTHPKYRRRGVSKESYITLMGYLQSMGVAGITANANFQNFASMALLYSLGFEQTFLTDTSEGMRGVYQCDLNNVSIINSGQISDNYKRLLIFCKMYLGAVSVNVQLASSNQISYGNVNSKEYVVSLSATNWACAIYPMGVIKKMSFRSNGQAIKSSNSTSVALINGDSPYIDPWGYCWELCAN